MQVSFVLENKEAYHQEDSFAIETGFGYGQWLHGEAVAAGMVMAFDMSYHLDWINNSIVKQVYNILQEAKLPTAPPHIMTMEMFKSYMTVKDDKMSNFCFETQLAPHP
ncbi:hypothetical protein HHK36_010322 [Tetracentron sinense]|uniref:3-dehydroquinate synthase C-terminal domain-containing protein n=1 Tax=Tetracentron sinense TaxID=13715 RepID=A0A834ZER5_TETSI|nr:hypothetical protein HHK36_010322 [Tetracentron sinense]